MLYFMYVCIYNLHVYNIHLKSKHIHKDTSQLSPNMIDLFIENECII